MRRHEDEYTTAARRCPYGHATVTAPTDHINDTGHNDPTVTHLQGPTRFQPTIEPTTHRVRRSITTQHIRRHHNDDPSTSRRPPHDATTMPQQHPVQLARMTTRAMTSYYGRSTYHETPLRPHTTQPHQQHSVGSAQENAHFTTLPFNTQNR